MTNPNSSPVVPSHYPYVTRSLLELYNEGLLPNVSDVLVEPEYGYVARISYASGEYRITHGNDLGLNTSSASELANDKGNTKFLLRAMGIHCPKGSEFLLPWWADTLAGTGRMHSFGDFRTTLSAREYVDDQLGYPVYLKPVDGSKGANVYKVHSAPELGEILDLYEQKRVRVAMVEEPIDMPDYRIVTLDGKPISAYGRNPLTVTGDGSSSYRQLLRALQEQFLAAGRDTRIDTEDPRIIAVLKKKGQDLSSVPAADLVATLSDVSNLSAGGTSEDVTATISSRWTQLAAQIADNFNLRLCGIDIACTDITNPDAAYSILEVNSSPGLDHYAASGTEQKRIVHNLYAQVFNALPSGSPR